MYIITIYSTLQPERIPFSDSAISAFKDFADPLKKLESYNYFLKRCRMSCVLDFEYRDHLRQNYSYLEVKHPASDGRAVHFKSSLQEVHLIQPWQDMSVMAGWVGWDVVQKLYEEQNPWWMPLFSWWFPEFGAWNISHYISLLYPLQMNKPNMCTDIAFKL